MPQPSRKTVIALCACFALSADLYGCDATRGLRLKNAADYQRRHPTELVVLGASALAYVWAYEQRAPGSERLRLPQDEQLGWDEAKRSLPSPYKAVRTTFASSLDATRLFSFHKQDAEFEQPPALRMPRATRQSGACVERGATVPLPGQRNGAAATEWVLVVDVQAAGLFLPRSEPTTAVPPNNGPFGGPTVTDVLATLATNAISEGVSKQSNASYTWLAGIEGCVYLVQRSTQMVIASGPFAHHQELEEEQLRACRKAQLAPRDPHAKGGGPAPVPRPCGSRHLPQAALARFPRILAEAIAKVARDTSVAMMAGDSDFEDSAAKSHKALVADAERLVLAQGEQRDEAPLPQRSSSPASLTNSGLEQANAD